MQMRNFHLMMAFISGLNNAAVARLKFTHERLSASSVKRLEEVQTCMDLSGSFKNYREALTVTTKPTIPYLGVHLQDLVFIEDGNPDRIDVLINWRKRVYAANVIQAILQYQDKRYPEVDRREHQQVLRFLDTVPQLSQEEMFATSLRLEPRGAQRQDIT
mgnify:CR=1 FL=1